MYEYLQCLTEYAPPHQIRGPHKWPYASQYFARHPWNVVTEQWNMKRKYVRARTPVVQPHIVFNRAPTIISYKLELQHCS